MNGYGADNVMNCGENSYGSGNALSTAAMVAAATATATATASVVALQDNSHFNNQQYSQEYPQRMMPMHAMNGMNPMANIQNMNMGGMHNVVMGNGMNHKMQGSGPTTNSMYPRRMTPYPSPTMHMSQKRQQNYPHGSTMSPSMNPSINPSMNPGMNHGINPSMASSMNPNLNQTVNPSMNPSMNPSLNVSMNPNFNPNSQYSGYGGRQPNFTQYPAQQSLGPTGNFALTNMVGNPRQLRQATPPYTNPVQYFNTNQMNHFPNTSNSPYPINNNSSNQYGNNTSSHHFQQDVAMRSNMNYQHSPIPGNPTPPLTPATSMPPYISPNPDIKPNFSDIKPVLPSQSKLLFNIFGNIVNIERRFSI